MRGDGRVFLRGTTYWCSYYLRGREFRESTGETDPDKAGKFLRRRLKEIHADEIGASTFITPQARRVTIRDLLEMLKAKFEAEGKASPQNLSHLRRADKDFGHHLAIALTSKQIDLYKKQRLAAGDRPASINRPLQLVRQAYLLAEHRRELMRAPYIELLSEDGNARQGFFSEQELRDVLVHLPSDLRDFVAFAAATGMRKNELASLTWTMMDENELQIPADITKNRKARTLPLGGQLAEIIERRKDARRIEENGTARMVEFIFHRAGQPLCEFRKSWARACVLAKVGSMVCPKCKSEGTALTCGACEVSTIYRGKIFHDLRRSAVRFMVKAGVAPQVAKKLSGHLSDSIFERYSILNTDDLREGQKKTEEYREAVAAQKVVVAIR